MSNRTFLHVDINAYFATLVQQENPHLRGKPIGIIKSKRRSCVIASSKEAKALGVITGSSVKDAKQYAPNLICIPAQFPMYLHATTLLRHLFASIAPSVEIYSLDEAFVEITHCKTLYPDAHQLGLHIQQRIKQTLGDWVTCNVGIASTRFLAKLAGEVSPKGSVTEVTDENRDIMFATAPFSDVCGIGHRLQKKLDAAGLTNLYLIQMCSEQELVPIVGKHWAAELMRMVHGEETHLLSLIDHNDTMKSVGRSITGYRLCNDEQVIQSTLYNLIEETTYKSRKMGLAGRQVWIGLWGRSAKGEHAFWSAHKTMTQAINTPAAMFAVAYDQLYKTWKRTFSIIKFSVRLSLLEPYHIEQQVLFLQDQKQRQIIDAVDAINSRFGLFTIRSAVLTRIPIIRPEVTGYLGDKIFQFQTPS